MGHRQPVREVASNWLQNGEYISEFSYPRPTPPGPHTPTLPLPLLRANVLLMYCITTIIQLPEYDGTTGRRMDETFWPARKRRVGNRRFRNGSARFATAHDAGSSH